MFFSFFFEQWKKVGNKSKCLKSDSLNETYKGIVHGNLQSPVASVMMYINPFCFNFLERLLKNNFGFLVKWSEYFITITSTFYSFSRPTYSSAV